MGDKKNQGKERSRVKKKKGIKENVAKMHQRKLSKRIMASIRLYNKWRYKNVRRN